MSYKSNANWNDKTAIKEEVNIEANAWKLRMSGGKTQQNNH